MIRLLLASALLFTLAACAPGMEGSSASSAFDVRAGPIVVSDAGSYYASYQVVPQVFGLDPDDFATAVVRNPRKGKKTSANITNRFSVTSASVPEDWEVALNSARLVKEVSDVGSRSVSYYYWLNLTFKISVPEDVDRGIRRSAVSVEAKGGEQRTIPLDFLVQEVQATR